ncbi:hypothetical protein MRB53_038335 [Persea americana]|nr:hypothetical protein MRB53_038335 [Persea americana]
MPILLPANGSRSASSRLDDAISAKFIDDNDVRSKRRSKRCRDARAADKGYQLDFQPDCDFLLHDYPYLLLGKALNTPTGWPIIEICYQAVQPVNGAIAVLSIVILLEMMSYFNTLCQCLKTSHVPPCLGIDNFDYDAPACDSDRLHSCVQRCVIALHAGPLHLVYPALHLHVPAVIERREYQDRAAVLRPMGIWMNSFGIIWGVCISNEGEQDNRPRVTLADNKKESIVAMEIIRRLKSDKLAAIIVRVSPKRSAARIEQDAVHRRHSAGTHPIVGWPPYINKFDATKILPIDAVFYCCALRFASRLTSNIQIPTAMSSVVRSMTTRQRNCDVGSQPLLLRYVSQRERH